METPNDTKPSGENAAPQGGGEKKAAGASAKPAPIPPKPAAPKPEPRRFTLSSSPHLRDTESVSKIMLTVTLTLVPAALGATWIFGLRALWLILLGAIAAVLTEWIVQRVFGMRSTIADGSALLTGVLVSFNLPPGVPWWIPVAGSFFAIAIAKLPFGGLGWNPMNPALVGRAFLLASWPLHMTKDWLPAFWWRREGFSFFTWDVSPQKILVDGISYATPLEVRKTALKTWWDQANVAPNIVSQALDQIHNTGQQVLDLAVGTVGGCIGETSALLLLIGAAYLLYKNYIDWRTPFAFIGVVALGGWMFGGTEELFSGDVLFHVFAGGLILGAFYMATDMVTTPNTKRGRLIFGAGAGVLTVMIRMIGGYPEGVSYAILLMNLTTPLIDRYTVPRRFGHDPKSVAAAEGGA